MRPAIVGFALLAGVAVASFQQSFSPPSSDGSDTVDEYQFDWPIRRVAVIGAGASGLVAYRELTEAGLDVHLFERDSVPGGDWHYTEEVPLDAPVPNLPTSIGSYVPSLPPEGVELPYSEELEDDGKIWKDHRGPKAMYESLTTNTPWHMLQLPQWPWPADTRWELSHYQVRNYVRSYASYHHINSNDENPAVAYSTRVEHVEKRINEAGQEQGWRLWLRSLEPARNNTYRTTWWTEDFDAVVVATGRYNAPFMATIPGLDEWVRKFPDQVRHSRQYRRPEAYINQTVLIIGASAGGTGVSISLNHHAGKIYQSFRPDNHGRKHLALENELRRIPKNTSVVGEIKQFLPITEGSSIQSGNVELKNGTILTGIDSVILATGFRFSFPFLQQYYDDPTRKPHTESAATISPFLPLDGTHIRDLYLDQFYIHDPTLAFIGMVGGSFPFVTSEYMTLAIAKVWTNTAKLPSERAMRAWYDSTVEERGGYGRYFSYWSPNEFSAHIAHLIGWLNAAGAKYGGKQVDGLPKSLFEAAYYWQIAHWGRAIELTGPKEDQVMPASLGIIPGDGMDQRRYHSALLYGSDW